MSDTERLEPETAEGSNDRLDADGRALEAPGSTSPGEAEAPESLEPAILVYDTHDPQPASHPEAEVVVSDHPIDAEEPVTETTPAEPEAAEPVTAEAAPIEAQAVADEGTESSSPQAEAVAAAVAASAAAMAASAPASQTPASEAPAQSVSGSRPIWSDEGDAPFDDGDDRPKSREVASDGDGGGLMAEVFDIAKTIVYALLIALVLRVFLFQPFTIPSASMEPNLYEGDYIVVSKWTYGYSRHSAPFSPPLFEGRVFANAPERGDIVVFKLPRDDRTDYIKRVIGLPGDRIQMRSGVLYINDEAVPDVVVSRETVEGLFYPESTVQARETLPGGRSFIIQDFGPDQMLDDTAVFEVPAGHYFMMGDNRDNSIDSRVSEDQGVGLVPEENLVGRAEMILFSWEPGASLFNPVSWFEKARWDRFFSSLQ